MTFEESKKFKFDWNGFNEQDYETFRANRDAAESKMHGSVRVTKKDDNCHFVVDILSSREGNKKSGKRLTTFVFYRSNDAWARTEQLTAIDATPQVRVMKEYATYVRHAEYVMAECICDHIEKILREEETCRQEKVKAERLLKRAARAYEIITDKPFDKDAFCGRQTEGFRHLEYSRVKELVRHGLVSLPGSNDKLPSYNAAIMSHSAKFLEFVGMNEPEKWRFHGVFSFIDGERFFLYITGIESTAAPIRPVTAFQFANEFRNAKEFVITNDGRCSCSYSPNAYPDIRDKFNIFMSR